MKGDAKIIGGGKKSILLVAQIGGWSDPIQPNGCIGAAERRCRRAGGLRLRISLSSAPALIFLAFYVCFRLVSMEFHKKFYDIKFYVISSILLI